MATELEKRRGPRIYSHEARLLTRFVGDTRLLERVGLDAEEVEAPDGSIPLLAYYDLVEEATRLTRNPTFGFRFGRTAFDEGASRPGAGALGLMVFASPTVHASVATLSEHQAWWNPGERHELSETNDHYFVRYYGWGPRRPAHDQLALRNMAAALGTGARAEGKASIAWVRAAMARPDGAEEVEAAMRCPVEWDAGVDEIAFPRAFLDRPMRGADPQLHAYAQNLLAQQQADALEAASFTVLVRREINRQGLRDCRRLADGMPARLGVSARTLQRRLTDEGASLRELIEEARRSASIDLLRADKTIDEVAQLLGYSGAAPFRRAFRRWFGVSPAEWRAHEASKLPR